MWKLENRRGVGWEMNIYKYKLAKQKFLGRERRKERKRKKWSYCLMCTNSVYLVGSIICAYGTSLNTISKLEYLMTCLKDLQTQNYIKQMSIIPILMLHHKTSHSVYKYIHHYHRVYLQLYVVMFGSLFTAHMVLLK